MTRGVGRVIVDVTGNQVAVQDNRLLTGTAVSGEVTVSDGGNSLTVDGEVTANIGTAGELALEATLKSVQAELEDITSSGVQLSDASGNLLAVPSGEIPLPNTPSLLIGAIDQSSRIRTLELVEDETNTGHYNLGITGKVSVSAPPTPPGGTKKVIAADTPLYITLTLSPHDTEYVITSGVTFTITQIVVGNQGDPSADGSKCEVLFDDGAEHIIERIYVMGASVPFYPDTSQARDGTPLVGNGTNKIIVRRIRLSQAAQEIDAIVRGFEI